MTISAVRSDRGFPRASCVCDDCGREEIIPAKNDSRGGGEDTRLLEGRVIEKIRHQGWIFLKGKLRCPKCEAKRRAAMGKHLVAVVKPSPTEEVAMTQAVVSDPPPLREPTPDQNFEISKMLEMVYDRKAKRYSGAETDKTVADAIGGGVMPGWVARVRETFFGPDGGNQEMEELSLRLDALAEHVAKLEADLAPRLEALSRLSVEIATMQKRVDAVRVAVGPKAGGR